MHVTYTNYFFQSCFIYLFFTDFTFLQPRLFLNPLKLRTIELYFYFIFHFLISARKGIISKTYAASNEIPQFCTGMITYFLSAIDGNHIKQTNIAFKIRKIEIFTDRDVFVKSVLGIQMNFSDVTLDFPIRRQYNIWDFIYFTLYSCIDHIHFEIRLKNDTLNNLCHI